MVDTEGFSGLGFQLDKSNRFIIIQRTSESERTLIKVPLREVKEWVLIVIEIKFQTRKNHQSNTRRKEYHMKSVMELVKGKNIKFQTLHKSTNRPKILVNQPHITLP